MPAAGGAGGGREERTLLWTGSEWPRATRREHIDKVKLMLGAIYHCQTEWSLRPDERKIKRTLILF